MFPSILALTSCAWLHSLLFGQSLLSPFLFHLFLAIAFTLFRLFSLHEIVIIHRFLAPMPNDLRLILFYLSVQSIFNAFFAKRKPFIVLILSIYRWAIIFILIFIFDQQVLFVISHHPSKIIFILYKETR